MSHPPSTLRARRWPHSSASPKFHAGRDILVWAQHPDINLATIYRTLELFERLDIAFHVHIGHGPSRWHLADDVHHHLVCEVCDKVIEIPDSTFDPLRVRLEADTGFVIDPHHFSLSGRCAECAAATPDSLATPATPNAGEAAEI